MRCFLIIQEGVQLAQRMERDGGYKAFILSYRIQPNTYPQCQMDLALAINACTCMRTAVWN